MYLIQTGCWISVVATLSLNGLFISLLNHNWNLFSKDWGDGAIAFMEKPKPAKQKLKVIIKERMDYIWAEKL
jgi:hypothetical protein